MTGTLLPPPSDGSVRHRGEVEDFVPRVPDAVDLVVETATMMSVFAAERLVRVDAMRRELLAEAAGRGAGMREVLDRSVRLELAAAMRITEYAAGRLIVQAEALVERYPVVLDALGGGRITEKHAEIFVDLVDQVTPELRDRVVAPGLVLAETEPAGSFRRALRDLIARVEASTLDQRYQAALTQRRVWIEQASDGMAVLGLHHPAVEVHAIHGRITAMAKLIAAADGEARTLDQIRADLVADLLIDGTTSHVPAPASGIKAQVVVTVPALSLLESDAHEPADTDAGEAVESRSGLGAGSGVGTTTGVRAGTAVGVGSSGGAEVAVAAMSDPRAQNGVGDPPVVEGIGPIPLSVARELCGGAGSWMRVLTHPETGIVLSVGRDRYKPPGALRRLVRWRADRCMAPGCGVPASRCEIDHQIRWVDGGETSLDNNAPFCKGHHLVKDNTGWTVRQIPRSGGAIEWVSPTGRRYVVRPERRIPAFRSGHDPDHPAPF